MLNRLVLQSAILLAVLALSACGKDGASSGQVVAKVNGDEITIHQVNTAMARLGKLDDAQAKETSKKILNSLVDQQLILKKAAEKKMDRDPGVMQAIEGAKRQIIAQAYIEKMLQNVSPANVNDVHEYYAKHPELFANRRVFQFQEILLENAKPETLAAIKEKLNEGKGMANLAQWMQAKNIIFKAKTSEKPAEQIPTELLQRIQKLKIGQTIMAATDKGALILNLVAELDQPVTEAQAKPAIEAYLNSKKRTEYAQAEIKKLHDAAKIEYLGAYADAGKLTKVDAPKAAEPAPTKAAETVSKSDKAALEKGLNGL